MAERELQKQVVEYLKEKNIFHFSIIPPSKRFMISGVKYHLPDIYILRNGISIFIELKDASYASAHKERQEKQGKVRQEIIKNGGLAYKITSLDELKEIL